MCIRDSNRIVDTIETGFGPYPQDTAAPREENGDELICSIARKGAEDIYGTPLPEIVEARLEKELGSITKHDFSTLYLSAYRLVKQSNDDGYTVGSRGSVGSSFVAKAMEMCIRDRATSEQALKHPKWNMGAKISIDSATLANKGLEVLEARWLFDVPVEQVEVVIHPESIVHSMVEYQDRSIIAQMGVPDMKLPLSLIHI